VDGYCKSWEDSDWLSEKDDITQLPLSVQRQFNNSVRNQFQFDISGVGVGTDVESSSEDHEDDLDTDNVIQMDSDNRIIVNSLSMKDFRNRLITHFNIQMMKGNISWRTMNQTDT